MGKSSLLKLAEKFGGGCIEVSVRHRRIGFSFLPEESLYVTAVFLQQSPRAVFRMTPEMHEQAFLLLFYKQVDAGLGGLGQNVVTTSGQRIFLHFIPPGMRKPHRPRGVPGKFVVTHSCRLKDAELFVTQPVTRNTVAVENASVRCQTGQDRRGGIALGPVQNTRQGVPVGFLAQVRM